MVNGQAARPHRPVYLTEKIMQILLILGIVFGIGAITFALQNNVPVTVVLALGSYDSTLAVVLMVALGLGALIAGLVSTPSVIRGQWEGARLRRRVARLADDNASLQRRLQEFESDITRRTPAPLPVEKTAAPYVGLKALLTP
jgi:uncharacterized integral membrane protein